MRASGRAVIDPLAVAGKFGEEIRGGGCVGGAEDSCEDRAMEEVEGVIEPVSSTST